MNEFYCTYGKDNDDIVQDLRDIANELERRVDVDKRNKMGYELASSILRKTYTPKLVTTPEQDNMLRERVAGLSNLDAIRSIRELTGASLMASKDYYENMKDPLEDTLGDMLVKALRDSLRD